jgi:hypothetical protein
MWPPELAKADIIMDQELPSLELESKKLSHAAATDDNGSSAMGEAMEREASTHTKTGVDTTPGEPTHVACKANIPRIPPTHNNSLEEEVERRLSEQLEIEELNDIL